MSEQDSRPGVNPFNLPGQAAFAAPGDTERTSLARASTMLYGQGAYEAAIEVVQTIKKKADGRLLGSALALEARALFQLGRDDEARESARAAIESLDRPGTTLSADERSDLAFARYLAGGADARARDELQERIAAGAATAEMYRFLGLTLLRLEAPGQAEAALRESRELEPSSIRTLQALAHCLEAQPSRQGDAAEVFYDLARYHYLAQRLGDAAAACARAVELGPTPDRLVNYGIVLAGLTRYDEALQAFDRAMALDPAFSDAQFRKGELLRLLGRHKEAVAVLESVPESAPERVLVLGSLGATRRALGENDAALALLDQAIALQPTYAFGLVERGETLIALGREDEALESLMKVGESDPMFPRAQFQIAELHRMRKRFADALRIADSILARDARLSHVLGTKAAALIGLDKPLEALDVVNRALEIEPDYAFGLSKKAEALVRLNRRAEAVAVYTRVLELAPDAVQTRFDLAENLRRLERFDEALVAIDQVLAVSPDYPTGVGTKGQILAGLRRRDEAVALLRRSLELDATMNWARSSLANTLYALGRFDESLAEFNACLEREPRDVGTLGSKGVVLWRLRRHDEAIAALDLALGIDETNTFVLATKGEVLCDQGHRAQGIELLSQAIALETQQAKAAGRPFGLDWAQFVLAENLRVLDRNADAIEVYDALLERLPDRFDVLGGKASALVSLERFEEAIPVVWRALEIEPDYKFGLSTQGALLANCGEYERALEPLTRAIAGDDASSYACLLKGFVCRALGKWPEGIAVLTRAVALDGNNLTARHLLGDVHLSNGDTDKAREIYQAILATAADQSDPDTVAIVGWCCFRLGDHERAVQHLLDAVSRGTGMAHAQFDLALSLLCSHREGLAAREYERAIEMATAEHQPLRRRGLYRLALIDLANARRDYADRLADNTEASEIESHLRAERDRLPTVTLPDAANAAASR
jgi:tetratricopeptide (TPR) repeat protein